MNRVNYLACLRCTEARLHYLCDKRIRLQSGFARTPDGFTCLEMIDEIFYETCMRVRQWCLMQFNQSFRLRFKGQVS